MKSVKHILVSLGLSVVMIISSCTDLQEDIYEDLTPGNLTFNEQEIASLKGGAYAKLRFLYWGWNGYFDIQEESGDLYMTPLRIGIGWGDLYISMHKHTFNSSIGHYWGPWSYGYQGIVGINQLLDISSVQENAALRAELRTLRALFYYILFDLFRNVPLVTTTNLEPGYLPEQVSPQELYDFIVTELTESKADLTTDKIYGQVNLYTANMILAKMYLNHNAWFNDHSDDSYYDLAITEIDNVLAGGYSLSPTYKENFLADLSGNSEVIFAIPLSFTHASHNYLVNKCLIGAGAAAFGYDGSPWNGSCAIPQFIDTYHANDQRLQDTWANGQQYDMETGDPLTANVDDQGEVNLVYTRQVHSIDNPGAYMLEGYRFVKNEIVAGADGTYGDDVPFFRLADAMFIKAECLLRLGRNQDEAAQLISDVRARSFANSTDATRTAADLTGASVYDYGHREYTNEGATVYDPASLVATYEGGDDIELGGLLDDLAWEFVGEHHRRQDLIRFRLDNGSNVFNGKSWFCKDAEADPTDMHKNVYPIHQDFLNGNLNLVQNPGY